MDGGSESGGGGGSPATVQMLQSPSSIPKPRNQHGNFDMPVFGGSQMGAAAAAAAAHMRQFSPGHSHDNSGNKRIGIPPSHPNNQQIMGSQSVSQQLGHQSLSRGPSHSRSLSQSAVFSIDSLPPLSPLPYSSSSPVNQPDPVLTDLAMEDRAGVPLGMSIPSPVMGGCNVLRGSEGLPPRRGHRRSMSDSIPLAFSAMIQSSPQLIPIGSRGVFDRSFPGRENPGMEKPVELVKRESEWNRDGNGSVEAVGERKFEVDAVDDLLSAYMNLENIDTLNSSCTEDKDRDSKASGSKTNGTEGSDNEVESRVKGNLNSVQGTSIVEKREGLKRTASGDFVSAPRHHRSLSMDSYMENLRLDDESLKLPPPGTQVSQHSPSNSMDQSLTKFNMEFGNGEFSETELKKIVANDKLTEIAMSDPKRAKRILANRVSAARSKERKMRYISELEQKVQTLQTEATTLSAQVTVLQRDSASLTSQNNELKFRLQAMEQQAQLKDALNEALIAEVQRLRIAAAELTGNPHQQLPINHHFQLQNQQAAQHGVCQQQTQAQTQAHQNNQLQSQKKNGEATTS